MKKLKVIDLAKASKARLFGDSKAIVENIVIDSRETKVGSMFVCIVGEVNDGHKFVESAYKNGARVFLMSDMNAASDLMQNHEDATVIFVQDTQAAFKDMAEWYLNLLNVKKIGVTGSVGKTTTKSLVAEVLSAKYKTVCSQKNYNTHLGLYMTTFLADPDTEMIVYEMGMDKKGEIDEYCSWVKPDTGVITIVGDSHLEKLGSKEAIADAKLEITHYMTKENTLIYNCDSPFLDKQSLEERTQMNFTAVPVGTNKSASVKIFDVINKGLRGICFDLGFNDEYLHIDLPLLGTHNATNAALAATCGMIYEVPTADICKALAQATGTDRRLSYEEINGMLLLDDSYNANPASMAAALEVLARIRANRHVAILGDMYELGEDEEEGHIQTGAKAGELGVDLLIAIGKNACLLAEGAMTKSSNISIVKFPDVDRASERVLDLIGRGDAVLIKGSNSTKVSKLAEMIRDLKN